MVFSSLIFIFIYLPLVLALYYITPLKYRNAVLFLVNLVFYGWGEPVYVLLMVVSITVSYVFGLLVKHYRGRERLAKSLVAVAVIIHMGLLFYFKYTDFLLENLARIPGLGMIRPVGILLPVGISFYTFQSLSYVIDVYRGDAEAQSNYLAFGTYVSLFPQLIAGPIVRYKDVAEQMIQREHSISKFSSGVQRFTIGLCKKVLLANSIGTLWDSYSVLLPAELSTLGAWLGALAFTFQIYFDFSGYSDMAIGLGRMLGFEFLENFNYPYISRSVTEFWRRWHISLGTWFREYVYIPLGGNRCTRGRAYLNILIVWALTGFWHGASWNFLLWGLYYALLLMLEKQVLLNVLKKVPAAVSSIYTGVLVIIGWVIFANDRLDQCGHMLAAMLGFGKSSGINELDLYYLSNYGVLLGICAIASLPAVSKAFRKLPDTLRAILNPILVALGLILSTAYLVDATYNPFLYFRF